MVLQEICILNGGLFNIEVRNKSLSLWCSCIYRLNLTNNNNFMKTPLYLLLILSILTISCNNEYSSLSVLQLNTWNEGGIVDRGKDGVVEIISQSKADIILLQEVRSQKTIELFIDSLKNRGESYYGHNFNISTAIMSKYPFVEAKSSVELGDDSYAFTKGVFEIKGQRVALYSIHLDWLYVGYYMLRGYDGQSWEKLDTPLLDADSLINYTNRSRRLDEISALIANIREEEKNGSLVIFGGDFNEPSHLDWSESTKDIRDHRGLTINWNVSSILKDSGFVDAYRSIYPNPVTHPGFTCNAGNSWADLKKLEWALGVDDRERIDFIYYSPNEGRLELESAAIVGPREDFLDGRIQLENTQDNILVNHGIWPSDHKGNLVKFKFRRVIP